jgi:hypothetical protein
VRLASLSCTSEASLTTVLPPSFYPHRPSFPPSKDAYDIFAINLAVGMIGQVYNQGVHKGAVSLFPLPSSFFGSSGKEGNFPLTLSYLSLSFSLSRPAPPTLRLVAHEQPRLGSENRYARRYSHRSSRLWVGGRPHRSQAHVRSRAHHQCVQVPSAFPCVASRSTNCFLRSRNRRKQSSPSLPRPFSPDSAVAFIIALTVVEGGESSKTDCFLPCSHHRYSWSSRRRSRSRCLHHRCPRHVALCVLLQPLSLLFH